MDGPASLGGILDLSLINGFKPLNDEQFVILTSTDLSGYFTTLTGLQEGNITFTVEYSPTGFANDVVLDAGVLAVPEPSSLVLVMTALVVFGIASCLCKRREPAPRVDRTG